MNNFQKAKDIISFIVLLANGVVALAGLWDKVSPELKRILKPIIDESKKITKKASEESLVIVEAK